MTPSVANALSRFSLLGMLAVAFPVRADDSQRFHVSFQGASWDIPSLDDSEIARIIAAPIELALVEEDVTKSSVVVGVIWGSAVQYGELLRRLRSDKLISSVGAHKCDLLVSSVPWP